MQIYVAHSIRSVKPYNGGSMSAYRSPYTTAQLLIINLKLYGLEKNPTFVADHYRFSRKYLAKCAGRKQLKEAFLSELSDELYELGWLFTKTADQYVFAVSDCKRLEKWPKLSTKRLRNQALLSASDEEIESVYQEMHQEDEDFTDDDE